MLEDMIMQSLVVCRYLISQYPEVEAKIAAELASLGLLATPEQPNPKPLEYADISKLTYLSCVIKVQQLHLSLSVPMSCPFPCVRCSPLIPRLHATCHLEEQRYGTLAMQWQTLLRGCRVHACSATACRCSM